MKKMKRLLAVLLSAILLLAMSATAFAANGTNGDTGTITIDNAVVGQTYSVYQIFTLESYSYTEGSETTGAYSYTIASNSKWYDFVNTGGAGADYVTLTLLKTESVDNTNVSTYYVTWNSGKSSASDYADFAKAALAYATEQVNGAARISATKTQTASSTDPNSTTAEVKFENLNLGYYLVDTTLGTLCSLDTTATSVTIREKNEVPSIEKKVQEGDTYGDADDANIGDTVAFQTTISAHEGAQNYVLHDKMSSGLTFDGASTVSVTLKRSGSDDTALTAKSDSVTTAYSAKNTDGYVYEVVTTGLEENDPCTFHIVFVQAYLDTLKDNDQLVVTYTATLNKDAVVGSTGNANQTKLDYGDDSSTAWDSTTTYTWELKVFKYTNYGTKDTPLANAKFNLVPANTDGNYSSDQNPVNFEEVKDSNGSLTGYRVCTLSGSTHTHVTEIVSDSTGNIQINGLDSGTYYLVETTAPDGYNKLAGPVKIVVGSSTGDNGAVTETVSYYDYDAAKGYEDATAIPAKDNTVKVLNNAGAELPSTGGMGTTILYILGAVLVVGAGILLIVRRRMNTEK